MEQRASEFMERKEAAVSETKSKCWESSNKFNSECKSEDKLTKQDFRR